MTELLAWLTGLPVLLLYGTLAVAAFAENVFPPLPADTVIALGAFVAARGRATPVGVWTATMIGNIGGAMLMYAVGHRFGLPWLERRVPALFPPGAAARVSARFAAQGMLAVVISRFLPGVRALVPPVAGACGLGAVRSALAMSIASGVWYGLVCVLAFRAGANAEALLARLAREQRTAAAIALGVAALVAAWRLRARARRAP